MDPLCPLGKPVLRRVCDWREGPYGTSRALEKEDSGGLTLKKFRSKKQQGREWGDTQIKFPFPERTINATPGAKISSLFFFLTAKEQCREEARTRTTAGFCWNPSRVSSRAHTAIGRRWQSAQSPQKCFHFFQNQKKRLTFRRKRMFF